MADNNKNRCFTIMIVPHSEEDTFSLKLPLYVVKLAAAVVVLFIIGFGLMGFAYLRASSEAKEAQSLREINRAQQEEIDTLAVETQKMMEQLDEVDALVDKMTDKLELESDENIDLQPQAMPVLDALKGTEENGHDRLYASRSSAGGVLDRAADNIALLQDSVPERTETLDVIDQYIDRIDAIPSLWPARGRISSGFGTRRKPYAKSGYQFHTGIDITGSYGSSIYASAPGTVTFTGYRGSLGNLVIIDHGYGYETYYAHLTDFVVTVGEQVERGQIIAHMGSSGRTTGTHLHYEVHHSGSPVNPTNYLKQL
ncbi:MAG: peptidoglycan DD-metalloendopeptidase family protein [Bacillota bacterium]|nr:peptidoglycan DD-metalloendopeptidase family protein [Bacillota bacterium]